MAEMQLFRKEDLSLASYIKDIVLSNFVEYETDIPLQLMPDICDVDSFVYEALTEMIPAPSARGRGWLYFDCVSGTNNCECYNTVSGTDFKGENGAITPESDYMIDYTDCRIVANRKLNEPTVTYYWNYVSLVDEWAVIAASDPPVVVIDMHGVDKAGYQLGGGKRSVRKVNIHIFASEPAERNDLVDTLYDGLYLKSCMLQNFPNGSPLDYDGTFHGRRDQNDPINKLTYLYNREGVENISRLQFENVTARHVSLPLLMTRGKDEVMLSDLNAYRSKVSFDLVLYDDRNIGRTYPTCGSC
jgi:hypothetical protein